MKKPQTQDTQSTIYVALSMLVKAHQVKILAGIKNRFDNHLDEIQRFCIRYVMAGGELNSDASFDFIDSNVRKLVFNVTREHGNGASRHVVTVRPAPRSVYGFIVTAEGGGNRDLTGKPKYHQAIVSHFTHRLRSSAPADWQEPDLHVPTFYTGPDDPLADVW